MCNTYLGIEFGSTRIKAVCIDDTYKTIYSSNFNWKSNLEDGIWTYDINEAWVGLKNVIRNIPKKNSIASIGISGMMHGYLAFDEKWNLLVPFRTWQNTITKKASEILTDIFNFNIPQRWSISHLFQAFLNQEEHIKKVAHITTLAGYIHYKLTGENVVGVGEASGIFPIDSKINDYDTDMLEAFNKLTCVQNWNIKNILPKVKVAGEYAGSLSKEGEELIDYLLPSKISFVPPEGDAGTGMVATNAISTYTGNLSAGTSIFSMFVLDKTLSKVYPEIDMVTTPTGKPVAMVHCNNCSLEINAWVGIFKDFLELFGKHEDISTIYDKLFLNSLKGDCDCSSIIIFNYLFGEHITHVPKGIPMILRKPDSRFNLSNFMKAQLYSSFSTLKFGMDILTSEKVIIKRLMAHGGLFKTSGVAQRYLAAATNSTVACMNNSGEGGPYGMALLAAYAKHSNKSLESFLDNSVFSKIEVDVISPDPEDVEGYNKWHQEYEKYIDIERELSFM